MIPYYIEFLNKLHEKPFFTSLEDSQMKSETLSIPSEQKTMLDGFFTLL